MKVIAVITEPEEVRKILRHLVKIGPRRAADRLRDWASQWRTTPIDPTSLNWPSVHSLFAPGGITLCLLPAVASLSL